MKSFDFIYRALAVIGFTDPIHPTMTHFPIALSITALIFGLAALALKRPFLKVSAQHCLVLSWLFFFPTVFLGVLDWQHFYHGAWIPPIIIKIWLAGVLFLVLSAGVILIFTGRGESKAILAVYVLSSLIVVALGYFGGHLVFGDWTPSAAARAQIDTRTLKSGEKIFNDHCQVCHQNGGNVILAQYPLRGSDKLANFQDFISFIRNPRLDDGAKGPMPGFSPVRISEAQARDLYQYLHAAYGQAGKKDSVGRH
jgi:mono/diheme cytochrome c family protein